MKHLMIATMTSASLIFASSLAFATASNKPLYFGIKGDIAYPSDSNVKGAATGKVKYGFSSGVDFQIGWVPQSLKDNTSDVRAELEVGYHAFGLDSVLANPDPSGDMKVTTFMANLYYDFGTQNNWTPYIGVGVGNAHVKFGTNQGLGNTDSTDNTFAWQGMLGLTYATRDNPDARWLIGYRYLSLNQPSFSTGTDNVKLSRVHEHALELGLQYSF